MLQEELKFMESKTVTKSNNEDAQSRMKLSRSYMGEDRDVQTPNNRSDLQFAPLTQSRFVGTESQNERSEGRHRRRVLFDGAEHRRAGGPDRGQESGDEGREQTAGRETEQPAVYAGRLSRELAGSGQPSQINIINTVTHRFDEELLTVEDVLARLRRLGRVQPALAAPGSQRHLVLPAAALRHRSLPTSAHRTAAVDGTGPGQKVPGQTQEGVRRAGRGFGGRAAGREASS